MNIIEKKKRQMGQGGFTLIELLVVIAILAVLAGLAVIGIGAMRNNAKKSACKADADTYQTAIEAFSTDHPTGGFPSDATQAAINSGSIGSLIKKKAAAEASINAAYNSATGEINVATACG